MKTATMPAIVAALVLLVALTASHSAEAIPSKEVCVSVSASGLDLSTQRGQEILYARINRAAKRICGGTTLREVGSMAQRQLNTNCIRTTVDRAVQQKGNKGLDAMHARS